MTPEVTRSRRTRRHTLRQYAEPGSGGLMNLAIFRRDVPVLSATILTIAALFVLINIAVDVLQAAVDPRIRR